MAEAAARQMAGPGLKVLVAGGFGFIGARLAQALQQAGHEVRLGTRALRPAPAWLPHARVQQLDWQCGHSLRQACVGVDAVVHVAGLNASACADDPAQALMVNAVGSARLVQAALQTGVARFFYFSTAHVYASPLAGELDESSCTRNPHPYASSHLAAEQALLHALSTKTLAGSVLRLSNGFGAPAQSDSSCWTLLTNDLCRQALEQGRLSLHSVGGQERDFLPLGALCGAVLRLLELPADELPPILNLGAGRSMSVLAMARLVQSRCQARLGFTPPIETGARVEAPLALHYRSLHAQRLQLPQADPVAEIDELLSFSQRHFRP